MHNEKDALHWCNIQQKVTAYWVIYLWYTLQIDGREDILPSSVQTGVAHDPHLRSSINLCPRFEEGLHYSDVALVHRMVQGSVAVLQPMQMKSVSQIN